MANIFYNSANGHFYEFVSTSGISWSSAKTLSEQRTHNGLTGYLATAVTVAERDFIDGTVFAGTKPDNVYVGGSDSYEEGVWRWVTGPEGLEDDGRGLVFFDGVSRTDIATNDMWIQGVNNGVPVGDSSNNDYLYMYSWWNKKFNPWNNSLGTPVSGGSSGYLVEYSGYTTANSAPMIGPMTFIVPEKTSVGKSVGTLTATDVDGDVITYSITAGNTDVDKDGNAAFAINPTTGTISVNDPDDLDFKSTKIFNLSIRAFDGSLSSTATVKIELKNIDYGENYLEYGNNVYQLVENQVTHEAAVVLSKRGEFNGVMGHLITLTSVAEQHAIWDAFSDKISWSVAGNFSSPWIAASDKDEEGIWKWIDGPEDDELVGQFVDSLDNPLGGAVNGDGNYIVLWGKDTWADYGNTSYGGQYYIIEYENALTVKPPAMTSKTLSVAENLSVGGVVGTLPATSPTGKTITYSITAGNTDVDGDGKSAFTVNSNTGNITVNDSGDLNYEGTNVFSLTVQASDGSLTSTAIATINLTNVNEAPTGTVSINATAAVVNVNDAPVGAVSILDPLGPPLTIPRTEGAGATNGDMTFGSGWSLVQGIAFDKPAILRSLAMSFTSTGGQGDIKVSVIAGSPVQPGGVFYEQVYSVGTSIDFVDNRGADRDTSLPWGSLLIFDFQTPVNLSEGDYFFKITNLSPTSFYSDFSAVPQSEYSKGQFGRIIPSNGQDAFTAFSPDWDLSFRMSYDSLEGSPIQGQVLTAANTLADADGIPSTGAGAIAYQWLADGVAIGGATSSTLVLNQAQVGKTISVRASYTDLFGSAESITSSATSAVVNLNDLATGSVTISGTATQGQTLTAANTLADADGLGSISYQWKADGVNINGATGSNFTTTQAQLGKAVTVVASYTDGGGTLESVASSAVQVANYNLSAAENTTTITTIAATNTALGTAPKFTLTGADSSLFKISTKGVLTFATAKDYEQAVDANKDGIYEVSVVMTNAKTGYKLTQDLTVGVEFAAIQGTANTDTLKGTKGWDTIDGLAGNDKLTGDLGLDTFIISAGSDSITDFNNLGTALGQEILQVSASASVSATLKATWTATSASVNNGTATLISSGLNIDLSAINQGNGWNLTNTGKTATLKGSMFNDVLIGGTGTDYLLGGAGNDVLNGGKGVDNLTGGAGADTFRFTGGSGIANADRITDFLSGVDKIQIDATLLKNETKGQLSAARFTAGKAATNSNQHFVYDNTNGNLWYDADGSGTKVKAVLVGVFDNNAALTASDVWVV